ncbi:MAG TPA: response regulator [Candidatus Sulfotelmatobacter sp.]|jgi:HD-like signal output (HDOD) protein|nr:response regulator [Candidatus Sulfotelmatobacter sp.]
MKAAILFIDDDTNLLRGLQRMLRRQREDWDMEFVDGGAKALEIMAAKTFDMVVSDMRMPELDGASLLSEVERLYPGTIRIILSGYAEEKSLMRSVGPAHQYLSKPCDAETIVALMDRTLRLQRILQDQRLRSLVASLRNLPSQPTLFMRLTEAMDNPLTTSRQIAAIVSEDVAMTAELLKVTNSSYFSFTSRVSSVEQAVRLLGLETVRTLVLHTGIFRQYEGGSAGMARIKQLSDYGIAVGALARKLARQDGAQESTVLQAECAGTLSGIGMLVLLDRDYGHYLDTYAGQDAAGIVQAEMDAFHATHAELGAYLLGLWGFADPVVEAVLLQLHPSVTPDARSTPLTYVHLARAFGPAIPLLGPPPYMARLAVDQAYIDRQNLSALCNAAERIQAEAVP